MELRRNQQRDTRRRRVLRDETSARSETTAGSPRNGSPIAGRTYTDAALAELQPRLTDFLPIRLASVIMVGLLTLYFAAVPAALHTLAVTTLRRLPAHEVLLVTGFGTITRWSAAVCLLLAAAVALLVFNIRRHKLDDYRGRYGMWAWTTLLLLSGSVDAATGIHRLIAAGLTELTGTPLRANGAVWWLLLVATPCSVLALRLIIEMRHCWAGCLVLLAAVANYALAACMYWQWWSPVPSAVSDLVHASCMLGGHTLILFTLILYARHVFLDAQGAFGTENGVEHDETGREGQPQRRARVNLRFWQAWQERRRARRAAAEAESDDEATSVEDDESDDLAEDDEGAEDAADATSSRAERRKQRKQQRRQQRQAA